MRYRVPCSVCRNSTRAGAVAAPRSLWFKWHSAVFAGEDHGRAAALLSAHLTAADRTCPRSAIARSIRFLLNWSSGPRKRPFRLPLFTRGGQPSSAILGASLGSLSHLQIDILVTCSSSP